MARGTVTQSQVAAEAGVSQAVVSAVLSGSDKLSVGADTRARVLAIANRLGYVSRTSTKGARTAGGASTNGDRKVLLVESAPQPAAGETWVSEPYQALMGGILIATERALSEQGVGFTFISTDDPQQIMQRVGNPDIAGVLWHASDADGDLLRWVASRKPLALLNRQWHGAERFDSVSIDQEMNVILPAQRLYDRGHRRIAFFGNAPGSSMFARRIAAYRLFAEQRNLPIFEEFLAITDDPEVGPRDKALMILEAWKALGDAAPSALITSDVFALYVLREAKDAGVRVPTDLSVIGIDNTSACDFVDPPLSSLREPFDAMCTMAVDLLLRRIADPETPSQTVQTAPSLVERSSVCDCTAAVS